MEAGTPFLLYRGADGRQVFIDLDRRRLTIGRRESSDVALPWDAQVSRVHAELSRMGGDWVVRDAASHNGTFVNGERVRGRRRLCDGDAISVGDTLISFCATDSQSLGVTAPAIDRAPAVELTAGQRRVLAALCRPLRGSSYAPPASNREIADELVISVARVKATLTTMFELFGLGELPQNAKRAALAARGLALLE
jgi:pSer/pThr/pTyr-binding forkhead associated (FHA) protein